jgi:hypothetical protein
MWHSENYFYFLFFIFTIDDLRADFYFYIIKLYVWQLYKSLLNNFFFF